MLSSGLVLDVRYFGGVAADYSRYKHTITATGVKIGRGKTGAAGIYNGTTSYLDCGNKASLNITNAITIEMWVKLGASNLNGMSFVNKWSNPFSYQFRISPANTLEGKVDDGSSVSAISVGTTLSGGIWYNLVYTFSANSERIYKDGVLLLEEVPTVTSINPAPTMNVVIGRDRWGTERYLNGTIDSVRIWNRALDAVEIKNLYDAYKSAVKNIIV